ncbi:hypothetical protein Bpfe_000526 [Biomphalaria pfeifferi]|uniref:Uncharacterized protein n=1 Tax=Biomphalaria pfeifferi TaxID=112525 RepID=A0AAD8CDG9_BIOPF|nr:hypothetical protein Bpfe_000526 [Biomphalaria pfeifferi]
MAKNVYSKNPARDLGSAAIRMGKLYSTLPYCLRKLPENQPRNRQEYMIRKWMNPGEIEVYFDGSNRFLYEAKTMAQQLEEIKQQRQKIISTCQEQTKYLRALIEDKPPAPVMDLVNMRQRYDRAVQQTSKQYRKQTKNSTTG